MYNTNHFYVYIYFRLRRTVKLSRNALFIQCIAHLVYICLRASTLSLFITNDIDFTEAIVVKLVLFKVLFLQTGALT